MSVGNGLTRACWKERAFWQVFEVGGKVLINGAREKHPIAASTFEKTQVNLTTVQVNVRFIQ